MGTALVIIGAIEAFTSTGFEAALVQRRDDVEQFYDSAFTLQVLRGACLALLLWWIAPAAALFFSGTELVPVLRVTGIALVLRGFVNPARLHLIRELRFDRLFWWSVPEATIGLLLAVGFGLWMRNVWALVCTFIGTQAVTTVVSHFMVRRQPHFALDWSRVRAMVQYSKWVLATHILDFLILQGDSAFVAKVLGVAQLGFYQVASRVAELPLRGFTQVVGDVGLPSLSAMQNDRERLLRWYFTGQGAVLLVQILFVTPVLLFGGQITGALLGDRWLPLVTTLKILTIAMVLRSFLVIASTLFNAYGEPRYSYRIHAARLAFMGVVIYPLGRLLGIEGVAIAAVVGLIGGTLVYFVTIRRLLNVGGLEHLKRLLRQRSPKWRFE